MIFYKDDINQVLTEKNHDIQQMMMTMFINIAIDTICNNFHFKLKKEANYHILKDHKLGVHIPMIRINKQAQGVQAQGVQVPAQAQVPAEAQGVQAQAKQAAKQQEEEEEIGLITPKFLIIESDTRKYISDDFEVGLLANNSHKIPKYLIIRIFLPKYKSAKDLDVDLSETLLILKSKQYDLETKLPYVVDAKHGKAKFNKKKMYLEIKVNVLKSLAVEAVVQAVVEAVVQ